MADIIDPKHEALADHLFERTCSVLGCQGFSMKPLRRRKRGIGKFKSFHYGYTIIGQKSITVDLYTPKTCKPRKLDAIIRVYCHELTHHQEPPRRMRYNGRLMMIDHHPKFWKRYKKNVTLCIEDALLGQYIQHATTSTTSRSKGLFRF